MKESNEDNARVIHNHFEAGSQTQVIQGHISGAIFAMPGATVNQYTTASQSATEAEPAPEQPADAEALQHLLPLFYGERKAAADFLKAIAGAKDKQITQLVNKLVAENILSQASCHRDLWQILSRYGLYHATESNWNMQVK